MRTEDDEQLLRVVSVIQQVLGAETLGAYLFGSAVLDGGLRPASDLDVFAVLRRRTSHEEKIALVDALLAISGRQTETGRWRRVELTVVAQPEVRPWRYPPTMDFQFGDWLRAEFENGNVEPRRTRVNPDLAVLITMVILANRPLLGPPPAVLLDPVPRDDLLDAAMYGIDSLRSEVATDTRNVILTFARIWATVVTGTIHSKDAAADWALNRLPDQYRPALARARAGYLADEQETWSQTELADGIGYVDYVISELRRLRREARTA